MEDEPEARTRLPAGRIVHIKEIVAAPEAFGNSQVRVLGRLKGVDCASAEIVLEHGGHELIVVTGHLSSEQHPARVGHLYSVIGEVDPAGPAHAASGVVVHARICRCMDGLDVALFERALEVKRRYDARVASLYPAVDDNAHRRTCHDNTGVVSRIPADDSADMSRDTDSSQ